MAAIAQIVKYEGDNSTFVWKHPLEDFNALTQLIVHESQEAIFMMNGEALDLFGPGRYTLESQNIPLIGKSVNNLYGKGKESPFHCEVYFINQTVQMALKWGTDSKVRYIDPESGVPLELGACGEMNLKVSDSRKLLIKLVGTMKGIAWSQQGGYFTKSLQDSFRPMITTAVKSNLTTAIKENNINILEVDEHLKDLSLSLKNSITPGFEEYGLTIPQFYLTTVVLPENDPNFRKIRDLHTIALQKRVAQAEAEVRQAQIKAEADVKTFKAQTDVEVTAAQRAVELERQTTETEILKREAERKIIATQAEAQARAIEAQGEAEAIKAEGFAEAEVMRTKGYTQKDVLQTDVQKAFAEGLGNMGSNGGGSSTMGDILGIGIGLQAAGAMGGQLNGLFAGMNPAQPGASTPEDSFPCPKCGNKLPAHAKFCMECGTPLVKKCSNCGADIPAGGKFCLECGTKVE